MSVLNILLIEDDMIEVMKLKRVISSLKNKHIVVDVNNGEKAFSHLEQTTVLPDIILLDLNMPKINGLEFLSIIKQKKKWRCIPTLILTTSNNPTDVIKCCELGVAGYLIKPLKYEDYVDKIKKILDYWSVNELIPH